MASTAAVGRETTNAGALPTQSLEWLPIRALAGLLALLLLLIAWRVGSVPGLLMLAYAAALCLPGLPVGFKLFGRRHAAGWISGALIGYASSASAYWIAIRAGAGRPGWFVAIWVILGTFALALTGEPPVIELPHWSRRDTLALLLTLLLVPAILWRPFTRIGELDATGARRYRAYFTADLLWHAALTQELARLHAPPHNPYSARQVLHYYWTYFVPPAIATSQARIPVLTALLVVAAVTGLMFVAMLYVFAWSIVPRAGPVAVATALVLLAPSAEGLYELWRLHEQGLPLQLVRNVNIDAVTLWRLGALTFDGLIRGIWYNPQHTLACALGLVALTSLTAHSRRPHVAALLAGTVLGLAAPISPFPAAVCAVAYGVATAWLAWRDRASVGIGARLLTHSVAAAPFIVGVLWAIANGMVDGAGGSITVGLDGLTRNSSPAALLLAIGPVLVPGLAGAALAARRFRLAVAASLLLTAAAALFMLHLRVESVWIGWRAGQLLQIALVPLVAGGLAALIARQRQTLASAIVALVLAAGLPTTLIDVFNAQDVSNLDRGPGFRWTLRVPAESIEALAWIREHTRSTAVVQMSIGPRERDSWTLVPSFAARRMAAGRPISLLPLPEYVTDSSRVDLMFTTTDVAEACAIADDLAIEFVYLDQVDRSRLTPAAIEKFGDQRGCFSNVFAAGAAAVYRVR